ncbi:hypothetical protein ACHAXS_005055 [Conticribra weissflogii]
MDIVVDMHTRTVAPALLAAGFALWLLASHPYPRLQSVSIDSTRSRSAVNRRKGQFRYGVLRRDILFFPRVVYRAGLQLFRALGLLTQFWNK